MKYAELNELHEEVKDGLDEISDVCSNLNDIDINELQEKLKLLWKHHGTLPLKSISSSQIKATIKELDVLFDVSKDCGEMEDIRNSDLDDFGVVEPESW